MENIDVLGMAMNSMSVMRYRSHIVDVHVNASGAGCPGADVYRNAAIAAARAGQMRLLWPAGPCLG